MTTQTKHWRDSVWHSLIIIRGPAKTGRVITRPGAGETGKVGVVTGGGSGHLPVFAGYCGKGLVDSCAVGNVFAGPSVVDCIDAIKARNVEKINNNNQ